MKSTHSFSESYYKNLWIILTLKLLQITVGCSANYMWLFEEPCDGSRKPHILSLRWVNCGQRGLQFTILFFSSFNTEPTVWLQGIWVIGKHATFYSWCKANIFFMFRFPRCLFVIDLTLREATCDIVEVHSWNLKANNSNHYATLCRFVLVLHNTTACSNLSKCKANRTNVAQHSLKSFYFNCFNVPSVHLMCVIITVSN